MSFFGFEQSDLEEERRKFLEGKLDQSEDIDVYNWGEESYDGLGDTLQERGDELNDETFGDTGVVGQCALHSLAVFLRYGSQGRTSTFQILLYQILILHQGKVSQIL